MCDESGLCIQLSIIILVQKNVHYITYSRWMKKRQNLKKTYKVYFILAIKVCIIVHEVTHAFQWRQLKAVGVAEGQSSDLDLALSCGSGV